MEKKYFPARIRRAAAITLVFVFLCAPRVYAVNILNRALYKKVALVYIHRYVLVNRLTGEVEYIMSLDGKWVRVQRALAHQYQSMYRAQYGQ